MLCEKEKEREKGNLNIRRALDEYLRIISLIRNDGN